MAAPSSDQTKPSSTASTAPPSQANKACGPPMALITSELTTNGPMPTISIMFRATASLRPSPRSRVSRDAGGFVDEPECSEWFIGVAENSKWTAGELIGESERRARDARTNGRVFPDCIFLQKPFRFATLLERLKLVRRRS